MSEKPFKDWEEVKRQIHKCGRWGDICEIFAFLFVIIGVIGDALNITLGLETMTWLLLAVFFAVLSNHYVYMRT